MASTPSLYEYQKEHYPQAIATQTLSDQQIAAQYGLNQMQNYNQFRENQAILVEQTNPNKIVDQIILSLQGLELKDDGSTLKVSEPHMNQLGISRVRFILRSILNQSTVLSHLEKEDIGRLIVQLGDSITDDLTLNWKEYGIQDKVILDPMMDSILFPLYFALKRAEGQNEKNWLGKISVESINNAPRIQQPKKESWLSKFKI